MEQLKAAATLAKTALIQGEKAPTIDISLITVDGAPVVTQTGLTLPPDQGIDAANDRADIIYLPALWRNPNPVVQQNIKVIPWLVRQYEQGSLLASVGTGCWFLAKAGLLDGKPATTHWYFFDKFHQQFPQVNLKRHHFITQANTIYCTGSVNSLADLTVHFIQRYFNQAIANHVERHFFHELRATYESSRTFQETHNAHPDEEIVQAQHWLQNHYTKEIAFSQLAETIGMSIRTFNRRFKIATAMTPLDYLRNVRMNNAKDLLQDTNLSINEIAFRVGYQDATHFSRLFKQKHGITPSQYRVTVRAKLFSPDR